MKVKLKVYEEDLKTVKKEVTAQTGMIPFGIVRKIMKVVKADEISNTADIVTVVLSMWDDITKVLGKVFPEIEEDDWDYVDTAELVVVLKDMLLYYFKAIMNIPTSKNN